MKTMLFLFFNMLKTKKVILSREQEYMQTHQPVFEEHPHTKGISK